MSVVVRGMEIPENCWECVRTDLNIAISVFGGMCPFCEKIRTDHDMQTGRHPECPLGALPDKHGRLVEFIDVVKTLDEDSGTEEVRFGDIMRAYYEMRNAPTIVEAEGEE